MSQKQIPFATAHLPYPRGLAGGVKNGVSSANLQAAMEQKGLSSANLIAALQPAPAQPPQPATPVEQQPTESKPAS